MTWRSASEAVVVLVPLLVILYDVAARYFGGNDATVSAVVVDATRRWPVVAAAIGLLAGHWLWPAK